MSKHNYYKLWWYIQNKQENNCTIIINVANNHRVDVKLIQMI